MKVLKGLSLHKRTYDIFIQEIKFKLINSLSDNNK